MTTRIAKRPVLYWVATLIAGIVVGSLMVGQVSAQTQRPRGLRVHEQNLDADGNIKVHEQGTVDVAITNSALDVTLDEPVEVTGGPEPFAVSDEFLWERSTWDTRSKTFSEDVFATVIHLAERNGNYAELTMWDDGVRVARFMFGPGTPVSIALPHPIQFDEVEANCFTSTVVCVGQVSVVGYRD